LASSMRGPERPYEGPSREVEKGDSLNRAIFEQLLGLHRG
jgi:hypothetical protein